ncbi:MAG: hypothetical protein ACW96S_11215 [Promethearchaeota archaeon]
MSFNAFTSFNSLQFSLDLKLPLITSFALTVVPDGISASHTTEANPLHTYLAR